MAQGRVCNHDVACQRRHNAARTDRKRAPIIAADLPNQAVARRLDFCKSLLGLPPLDFLFGSALVSEQLHLHESVQMVL